MPSLLPGHPIARSAGPRAERHEELLPHLFLGVVRPDQLEGELREFLILFRSQLFFLVCLLHLLFQEGHTKLISTRRRAFMSISGSLVLAIFQVLPKPFECSSPTTNGVLPRSISFDGLSSCPSTAKRKYATEVGSAGLPLEFVAAAPRHPIQSMLNSHSMMACGLILVKPAMIGRYAIAK